MLRFNYADLEDLSPIPIASLYIGNSDFSNPISLKVNNAILDTGSDCTLFPYSIISRIQPISLGSSSKQSFRGLGTQIAGVPYRVGIGFEEHLLIKVKVFACPDHVLEDEIIIGRNFLNRYRIEFDGPKRVFLVY